MRLLVDTQAALWWFNADPRLSVAARRAIGDPDATRYFSIASAWEMAIKRSLGKLKLPAAVQPFLEEHLPASYFVLLPIGLRELSRVESLPLHHRDPFDRLLAAQAIEQKLTMVSSDPVFRQYGVKRVW